MTDTGQVPGEGLPENAGMVEQPGVTAPGAYTYLDSSESSVEEDDLLLLPGAPGAQGAWGNEVPPPAPMPFTDEPGPHETDGRDTGAIDLGAVRAPSQAPVPQPVPQPVTPRRPLHLGPPTPDGSSSPVRSLADRGPAGARPSSMATPVTPLRHAGSASAYPEYLDVPQAYDALPQSAAVWGTVPMGGEAADTVVPEAAQLPGSAVMTEPAPGPEAPQAAEAEQMPDVVAAPFVQDPAPAPAFDAAQAPVPGADGVSLDLQDPVDGTPAPEAVPAADGSAAPQIAGAPQFQDALGLPDTADVGGPAPIEEETSAHEAVPTQITEDLGPAVPAQPFAPAEDLVSAEDPAAAQVPPQLAGQDTHGAGLAAPGVQETGFAEPAVHLPEPAVLFVDEASLSGAEQPAGVPAPHVYETPESALSAPSARSAEASQGGQDIAPDEVQVQIQGQRLTGPPAVTENGTALSEDDALAHDGIALSAPGTTEAPPAAPAGVAAQAEAAHETVGDPHLSALGDQYPESAPDAAGAPGFPGAPVVPQADQSLGGFVPVDGTVPTAAHLAPTPPHGMTMVPETAEEQPPPRSPRRPPRRRHPSRRRRTPPWRRPSRSSRRRCPPPGKPRPSSRPPPPFRSPSPRSRNPWPHSKRRTCAPRSPTRKRARPWWKTYTSPPARRPPATTTPNARPSCA